MNTHTLRVAAESVRTWTEKRDRLILDARAEGASLRDIAEVVGLTHPTIARICRDAAEVKS